MTKKKTKRFTFDIPIDSPTAKWLENQNNRKASIDFVAKQAIAKFGYKDVFSSIIEDFDLFGETSSTDRSDKEERGREQAKKKVEEKNKKHTASPNKRILGMERLSRKP